MLWFVSIALVVSLAYNVRLYLHASRIGVEMVEALKNQAQRHADELKVSEETIAELRHRFPTRDVHGHFVKRSL